MQITSLGEMDRYEGGISSNELIAFHSVLVGFLAAITVLEQKK